MSKYLQNRVPAQRASPNVLKLKKKKNRSGVISCIKIKYIKIKRMPNA
jgi:hypothetical protein